MIDPRFIAQPAPSAATTPDTEATTTAAPFRPWQSTTLIIGLFLIGLNAALYGAMLYNLGQALGMALVAHIFNASYMLGIFAQGKRLHSRRECWLIWLNSCMLTCFTLNKDIAIFAPFANWVNVLVGLGVVAAVGYAWRNQIPVWAGHIVYGLLGLYLCFCFYLSLYLITIMPIALIGLIWFGLGIYAYIPFFFLINILPKLDRAWATYRVAILTGFLAPILFFAVFLTQWGWQNILVKRAAQSDLPVWAAVARQTPPSWMSWRYFSSSLFYQTTERNSNFGWGRNNFNREVRHDPLVYAASFFIPSDYLLPADERAKVLHAVFGTVHDTEARLWSGRDLVTESLRTQVDIKPELRLATTELTLEVKNTAKSRRQEAIYVFHLPEGSTVADLSLWINGVEEKGHLTTRNRATTAYNTIVGREVRDPSVVHWKEGNAISVRVFPCPPDEARRFKIGFITPLREENDRLVYENAWFEGPPVPLSARQLTVSGIALQNILETDVAFKPHENGTLEATAGVTNNWELTLRKPPMTNTYLRFRDRTHVLTPIGSRQEAFRPKNIYLDVNDAWTREEWVSCLKAADQTPCWVWLDGAWATVTAKQERQLFRRLRKLRFSLFPFQYLPEPSTALVITKSGLHGPRLSDLKGSRFATDFQTFSQKDQSVKTLSIGRPGAPFLRSLRELGLIRLSSVDLSQVISALKNQQFPTFNVGATDLPVETAGWVLRPSDTPAGATVPQESLTRLAAYHQLMRQIGRQYFASDSTQMQETWIEAARRAGVVSPVSSLIVLETQQDYKRFGIDQTGNPDLTAQLAAKQTGAVPEPHEWALLIMALSFIVLLRWKKW
jgi:XrtN system VIT domain protein